MNWLFEDPLTVIVAGVLIEILLGVALSHTGEVRVLWAMGGVLGLTLVLLVVEQVVVTDREQIADTLTAAAAALETNNAAAISPFIAPEAADMRARAEQVLSMVKIEDASFSGLEVILNSHMKPPTAQANFIGKFSGQAANMPYKNAWRRLEVDMRREGDRWVMTDYKLGGEPGVGGP